MVSPECFNLKRIDNSTIFSMKCNCEKRNINSPLLVPKYRNYQKIATRSGLCLWCFKMRKPSHRNVVSEGENVERSVVL